MAKAKVLDRIPMGEGREDFVLTERDTIGVGEYLHRREKSGNRPGSEDLSITAIPRNVVRLTLKLLDTSISNIIGRKF